jgi:hypothetical protein
MFPFSLLTSVVTVRDFTEEHWKVFVTVACIALTIQACVRTAETLLSFLQRFILLVYYLLVFTVFTGLLVTICSLVTYTIVEVVRQPAVSEPYDLVKGWVVEAYTHSTLPPYLVNLFSKDAKADLL